MTNCILETQNVWKSFNKKVVLNSVSFSVFKNDIICLLGKTGKGKTTLFNIISGLDKSYDGSIETKLSKSDIEYVFQEDILLPWLNVEENIWLSVTIKDNQKDISLFQYVVEKLELKNYLDFFPYQLSGGTKRRVSIARALVNNPRMLILDEPFNGLDFSTKANTEKLLQNFIDSKDLQAIIYSSHILESSVNFSTKLLLLDNGNTIRELTISENLQKSIKDNILDLQNLTLYDE